MFAGGARFSKSFLVRAGRAVRVGLGECSTGLAPPSKVTWHAESLVKAGRAPRNCLQPRCDSP